MSRSRLLTKSIKTIAKQNNLEYAEDIFPILEPNTIGKTRIWEALPSKLFGVHTGYLEYTKVNTLYKKRGLEAVLNLILSPEEDKRVHYFMLLFPKALENIHKVAGITPDAINFRTNWGSCVLNSKDFRKWEKILRGRDLFIPGMGTFDIEETVNLVLEGGDELKVEVIQALGHFNTTDAKGMLSTKVWLPHMIRYKEQWKQYGFGHSYDLVNYLDMNHPAVFTGRYMEMSPERLWNLIETERELDQLTRIANSVRSSVGPFPQARLTTQPDDGTLQHATDAAELARWGKELNICVGASYYAEQVMSGIHEIWRIEITGHGPVICQLNKRTRRIEQIKGARNASPDRAVRLAVQEHLQLPYLQN